MLKRWTLVLLLPLFFLTAFCSTQKELFRREGHLAVYPAEEYVIASRRGAYRDWTDDIRSYYLIREGKEGWSYRFERIDNFSYTPGHEYTVLAEAVEDLSMAGMADGPERYWFLRVLEVLSAEEKESEDLPENISYFDE